MRKRGTMRIEEEVQDTFTRMTFPKTTSEPAFAAIEPESPQTNDFTPLTFNRSADLGSAFVKRMFYKFADF